MLKTLVAALVIFVACTFGSAHAALVDNGGGLIYDTDLNITWYDNPYYPTFNATYSDYASWAANLDVQGVTGWRLPTTPGTTLGYTHEGEMGHLFYTELQNPDGTNGVGQTVGVFSNKGPFTKIVEFIPGSYGGFYTEPAVNGNYYCFSFDNGWQYSVNPSDYLYSVHGLAVHNGNVGGSAVPLPPTVLLLGSGLLGLAGWRRFRKS
jgi:hypothetical protein